MDPAGCSVDAHQALGAARARHRVRLRGSSSVQGGSGSQHQNPLQALQGHCVLVCYMSICFFLFLGWLVSLCITQHCRAHMLFAAAVMATVSFLGHPQAVLAVVQELTACRMAVMLQPTRWILSSAGASQVWCSASCSWLIELLCACNRWRLSSAAGCWTRRTRTATAPLQGSRVSWWTTSSNGQALWPRGASALCSSPWQVRGQLVRGL